MTHIQFNFVITCDMVNLRLQHRKRLYNSRLSLPIEKRYDINKFDLIKDTFKLTTIRTALRVLLNI